MSHSLFVCVFLQSVGVFIRLQNAVEGSYTRRLFNDPELLRKKLLEESQELIEAETVDHVAAEAADVIYFAMVKVVAAGASLNDVEKILDQRGLKVTRRPGNAKSFGHAHFVE
jgi:phosphoribosyl-ATP pyrophosphohydrolase/phosphoribosyl-AMP cyclohydrolase/histidinol dehydrogenase